MAAKLFKLVLLLGWVFVAPQAQYFYSSSQNYEDERSLQDGWILVFEDDFRGNKLDLSKWEYQTGCGNEYGKGQHQCYYENNVQVAQGRLIITARSQNGGAKRFSSGRIRQSPAYANIYGRFVVRARLPSGRLLFPAIWLKSRSNCYQEIDIIEMKGEEPDRLILSAFYGSAENPKKQGTALKTGTDYSRNFHDYEIIWNPKGITWYVDRQHLFSVSMEKWKWGSCGSELPFQNPMSLILNLAVGGSNMFPGKNEISPEEAAAWQQPTLEIEYVRIYKQIR